MTAAFAYDGFARRRSLTTAATTGSLHDGLNVVQHFVGSTVTANFLTGDVDQSFQRTDATGTQALLTDALGSTMALTNAAGAVHTRYSYEPFGVTTVSGSASGLNAIQYTGRENDGTGLYFYRARYYSPQLGRFISEDPIGFAGGLNLFAYVGNSPINRVDPTGLFACKFHKMLTQGMATEVGYTLSEAMSLAQQVCDVDDRDGAAGNNPDTTHHHSMGGRKPNGNFETCTEAYDGTKKLLQQLLEQNKLADALHLIQDQWPTGHRFKPWDSYTSWPPGTSASNHWAGDNTPSWDVLRAAGEDTKNLLRDMRSGNATDPSKYLHNFCK